MSLPVLCISYVINAPYFWMAMGFTTAIGMFLGAVLYDGNLTQVGKGLVSIGSYAIMLLFTIGNRINNSIATALQPERAYASILSILFVTLAWMIGVFLGVLVINFKYRNK